MDKKLLTSVIFNNLRILHQVTPSDGYIFNYLWHYAREKDDFFDIYHLAFWWGAHHQPKNVMEIGARTGLSLAQLLSAYMDVSDVRVVLFDFWNDGISTPTLIKKHLNHLGIHTKVIEFYQGDSRHTVPEFMAKNGTRFDWILVDGDHSPEGAMNDLENAVKLVSEGGVIVFDDIVEFDGVKLMPTWNAFKQKYKERFEWNEDLHGKGVGWAVCRS